MTALSFHEEDLAPEWTNVMVAVDEKQLEREVISRFESAYRYGDFVFYVAQYDEFQAARRVYLSATSAFGEGAEWALLVQLRIKTGQEANVLNVVDKDIFRFDRFQRPISVELQAADVKHLKVEMRVLNMMSLVHPKFNEGEVWLTFDDGSTIGVYKNILSLLSGYMQNFEKQSTEIRVTEMPKKAFLELLYQVYPTRRPIYVDFRALALAAVGLQCNQLILQLSKHLVEFNARPMPFEERFRAAIENQLTPAIQEIAFRAARDGTWDRLIQKGFEPESFCGKLYYTQFVCSAVLKGRRAAPDETLLPEATPLADFLKKDEDDDTKTSLMFRGTTFYVNSGLLEAHGRSKFSVGKEGELIAIYSLEFQNECARANLLPGEVLLGILGFMLPGGSMPAAEMLRAAIVFCYDHDWTVLKEDLEQELLHEPPLTVNEYMSQLLFAERFGLANMLRINAQRAESSCNEIANQIASTGLIDKLHPATRELIVDRMCSGWGLHPSVNRLATRMPTNFTDRRVDLERGHVLAPAAGRLCDTLASIQSEYAFGEPTEMQLVE